MCIDNTQKINTLSMLVKWGQEELQGLGSIQGFMEANPKAFKIKGQFATSTGNPYEKGFDLDDLPIDKGKEQVIQLNCAWEQMQRKLGVESAHDYPHPDIYWELEELPMQAETIPNFFCQLGILHSRSFGKLAEQFPTRRRLMCVRVRDSCEPLQLRSTKRINFRTAQR